MPKKSRQPKVTYPLGTVIPYGPDDRTVTKLAASVVPSDRASDEQDVEATLSESWVGTKVASDEKVAREIYRFFRAHNVKTVITATAILGCPHEEGEDFPHGEDCPFCPFWKGKQGSGTDDSRWDALHRVRRERLGFDYRFWLPGQPGS